MLTTLFALPSWLKVAIVSVAVVGAVNMRHWWIERGLRKEIATLTQVIGNQKTENDIIRQQVFEIGVNRDMLRARIVEQNRAIEVLQQTARTLEAKAAVRAVRVLSDGASTAAELRAPDTHVAPGHLAMNTWLQERFAQ